MSGVGAPGRSVHVPVTSSATWRVPGPLQEMITLFPSRPMLSGPGRGDVNTMVMP